MASLLYFLFRRIYLFLAFSIKKTFAEWELEFSHMMHVCPEKADATGSAGPDHNTGAPCLLGQALLPGLRTDQKTGYFGSTGQQLFFQSRATI
ncbi:hypothetical protein ELH72_29530 (plasmid) [Rhizobium ruizarguesonis]|nr:hypothetical protein ELH72_29530 [Rhizobium ruizarguesonis]